MRLLLSVSGVGASLSLNAMREELGLCKLEAMATGQRARAVIKFSSLRTLVAELVKNPLSSRKATWVPGTNRWLSRYKYTRSPEEARASDPSGQAIQRQVRHGMAEKELQKDSTETMRWRTAAGFRSAEEAGINQLAMKHSHLAKGLAQLCKLRCKAYRFAPWLVLVGLILPEFRDTCPMCLEATREDEAHLLLSCKSFAEVRVRFLATWVLWAMLRAADSGGIATLLLGGSSREDNSMVGHNPVGTAVVIQNLGLVGESPTLPGQPGAYSAQGSLPCVRAPEQSGELGAERAQ